MSICQDCKNPLPCRCYETGASLSISTRKSTALEVGDVFLTLRKEPERGHSHRWAETYFRIAKAIAGASKDPTTKVGAVIVRPDKTVASVGFNGFPRGLDDSPEAYADRDRKLRQVVHAELNCLLHMKEPATGCTLYVWPLPPCERCAPHIIQSGIVHVVSPKIYAHERWFKSATYARAMFDEAGVTWEEYASDHV